MNSTTVLISLSIILWGLWGFFGKLAVSKITVQAIFWSNISLSIVIISYLLLSRQLFPLKVNGYGILFGILAGLVSGLASICFYIVLGKKPAGYLVTATALYPAVTIILSMLFLKESITPLKLVGFLFAFIALIFLNL